MIHLNDSGLFIITTESPSPTVWHPIVPTKQRFYSSVSGLLLITADSLALADQTPQILHTKGLGEIFAFL